MIIVVYPGTTYMPSQANLLHIWSLVSMFYYGFGLCFQCLIVRARGRISNETLRVVTKFVKGLYAGRNP